MKKTTKGIAAGVVAVCILAGMGDSSKKAESLEISIPLYQESYDINTEIPIGISVFPDDSSIDDLEYCSDSDDIAFSDSVIKTGQSEGDYSFYVRSGDVESNTLSIHVVDITARNEATQKAEEERLAKEAEEKKAAEKQAAREAEEKVAAEQAAREAEEQAAKETEEQKAAEEQSAKEAEEKIAAEQVAKEMPAVSPEAEPAAAPQPIEEPAQIAEAQVQEVPVSGTAYLSATGSKYHSIDHCGKMNPNKARKTTILEAEAAGYERCSKCW